jgi:hypothetical protein
LSGCAEAWSAAPSESTTSMKIEQRCMVGTGLWGDI